MILVGVLILVILIILASCVKVVPQATALVMERLGAYNGTWPVGIHFKVPIIDRVAKKLIRLCSSRLRIRSFLLMV